MKMDKTQDCDEVVSSTGRCHWHQIHAHNRIHVTCDTVEAQHADRTSSLVKDVPDPPLPVASEDLVRSGGRHGRLLGAAARQRGNCIDTENSAGCPADGFSPVPACLLARRLTQRAEMQGLWDFGCTQGGIVSARAKPSTRYRCGQRGNVLPNVALRSVRVSVMLVHRPDARTLARAWGRGVQPRLQGSWQRTGGRTRLQDTQPAD